MVSAAAAVRAAAVALVLAAAALALALAGCGGGGDGEEPAPPPGRALDVGWPRFGNDDDQSRFSPLATVDRDSVHRLGLAWSWAPEEMALWESFPVVAGRTLYVTTNTSQVLAFNAATGARRWTYTPQVDFFAGGAVAQQPTNRGVAVADGRGPHRCRRAD
ncbi:MAG TPA: hypothetical protein VLK58_23170, partial [Conexibacter sp.]|nr:hypothetical protein [Conexibacter sp.]